MSEGVVWPDWVNSPIVKIEPEWDHGTPTGRFCLVEAASVTGIEFKKVNSITRTTDCVTLVEPCDPFWRVTIRVGDMDLSMRCELESRDRFERCLMQWWKQWRYAEPDPVDPRVSDDFLQQPSDPERLVEDVISAMVRLIKGGLEWPDTSEGRRGESLSGSCDGFGWSVSVCVWDE